jgi:hypothetical protein
MERHGVLILEMDVVSRVITKSFLRIAMAVITKEMPKINKIVVLLKEAVKMDGMVPWMVTWMSWRRFPIWEARIIPPMLWLVCNALIP